MQLDKLEVTNYRGVREFRQEFKNGRSFLVCGPNGTGKSSIFQALYFAFFGKLANITGGKVDANSLSQAHLHRGAAVRNEPATVRIEFSEAGQSHWIERRLDPGGPITTSKSSNKALEIASRVFDGVWFLTRREFSEIIETVERDRWRKLSPLVGHQTLANFRAGLRNLKDNLRRDLGLRHLQNEISNKKQLRAEQLNREREHVEALKPLDLSRLSVRDALKTLIDDSKIEIDAEGNVKWTETLKNIPEQLALKKLSVEFKRINQMLGLCTMPEALDGKAKKEKAFQLLDLLKTEAARIQQEMRWNNFLASSLNILGQLHNEVCPLCEIGTPQWQERAQDIRAKLANNTELQEGYKACTEYLRGLSTRITLFRSHLDKVKVSGEDPPREQLVSAQNAFEAFGGLAEYLLQLLDSEKLAQVKSEEIDRFLLVRRQAATAYTNLRKSLAADLERAKAEIHSAEPETIKRILLLKEVDSLSKSATLLKREIDRAEAKLEISDKIVEKLIAFYREIEDAESELSTQALLNLKTGTESTFATITGNNNLIPELNITTPRGIREAEFLIKDFYGFGEVSARDYLSEANRNALGLSIFLASVLNKVSNNALLVMDDITHSADYQHRLRLVDFIEKEFAGRVQLLIFTHDDVWFRQLQAGLSQVPIVSKQITRWTVDGIETKDEIWKSLLDDAVDRINNRDATGGNTLRRALEGFVDNACEKFRVMLPFKTDTSNIKLNEKRQGLIASIKDAWANQNGIIDPNDTAFKKVEISQTIANLASHQSTFHSWSQQDLEDARDLLVDWIRLFQCKNPLGQSQCGQMLSNLTQRNGMPLCRRCNLPFRA